VWAETDLMRTSIIIPCHRLAPVPLCLKSLEACVGINEHQFILIQQGCKRFDFDKPGLVLRYAHIRDDGPFNLAKLLNAGVEIARTDWVTFVDPCLIVPPNFLISIENAASARKHRLIYFPIRHLDSDVTDLIAQRFDWFLQKVIPVAWNWRLRCETYNGYPIGTDCFAVLRSDYIDAGGFDEGYRRSDLAHIDFACRWLNESGRPYRGNCDVFHRWRRREFWTGESLYDIQARKHFAEQEQAGFPPLAKELRGGRSSPQMSPKLESRSPR
jgi:hypothetical protein